MSKAISDEASTWVQINHEFWLSERRCAEKWEVALANDKGRPPLARARISLAGTGTARIEELHVNAESDRSVLPALLYSAGRRARIEGARVVQLACESYRDVAVDLMRLSEGSPHSSETPVPWQRLDIAMCALSTQLEGLNTPIASSLMVAETRESVMRWLEPGETWGFFQSVLDGSLSKDEYIYALGNVHQFVRHTTRILGRCIAHGDDSETRRHFINHLNGEVNHELIVEHDLAHLNADVHFVQHDMPPNLETLEFMAVQESAIAYHQDPLLLVASPLAAEGVTAHMSERFMERLRACISSWGVKSPEKACQFFSSHMTFDGGMDGHWEGTLVYLERILKSEPQFQRFLTTCRASMGTTTRMYESFTRDLRADSNLHISS